MAQYYAPVGHGECNALKISVRSCWVGRLRGRETFWIVQLKATKQPGINDDIDLSPFVISQANVFLYKQCMNLIARQLSRQVIILCAWRRSKCNFEQWSQLIICYYYLFFPLNVCLDSLLLWTLSSLSLRSITPDPHPLSYTNNLPPWQQSSYSAH